MRPTHVWTLFAICLAVVLVAMAWSSAIVLRLERAEVQAQAQAVLEENARLALWRMDSALTPLLSQESVRPYFHYGAYYAAKGSYARMFADSRAAQPLVPSPLLRETPGPVLLHFQLDPGGTLSSPQVPAPPLRARALLERHTTEALLSEHAARLRALGAFASPTELALVLPPPAPPPAAPAPRSAANPPPEAKLVQKLKNVKEFEARQQSLETNKLLVVEADRRPPGEGGGEVQEGAMTPLWIRDALLLARRVRVGGGLYIQGCWIAWPRLRDELLRSVHDLLPNARLEPVAGPAATTAALATDERRASGDNGGTDDDERRLAALPVRLVPGSIAAAEVATLSPTRLSLAGAWICLLLAALSVAALLGGVLSLSERRRVFVSAVTHELRTPLTTFRLYADMLAGDMVATEDKRRDYLQRIRTEAERLGHLVENVLFYSRLESGRGGGARETLNLMDALEQARPLLFDRAARAGLWLSITKGTDDRIPVLVDVSALEQAVVNLVDNACKYAAASAPPAIEIEVGRHEGRAVVRVRDHGPGLSKTDRRRLFRPFSKSDREAAAQGPGVGLGLALSRRLIRAQGGDLALDASVTDGASFVITLPIAN